MNYELTKGIIFDYGGTLDSGGDHWSEVIRRGYQTAGLDIPYADFRDAYVYAERELARTHHILPHHDFLDLMRIKIRIEMEWLAEHNLFDPAAIPEASEAVARYCDDSARRHVEQARPVLETLKAHYPMVLVSNFYGNVTSVLRSYGLDRYFDSIVESAVVGVRKPDPKIFALGVEALGLPPEEVLVIGDSLRKDILPAESLGCMVMWIKGKGWTPEEDAAEHPSRITSIEAVPGLLGL